MIEVRRIFRNALNNARRGENRSSEQGDTLIEVAIAMAVLGTVALLTFTTMNNSLLSIMDSTQRTSVQQMVNSQIEMINYIRDNDPEEWKKFVVAGYAFGSQRASGADYRCRMTKYSGNNVTQNYNPNYGSVWLEYDKDDADHPVKVYNLSTVNGSKAKGYWGSVSNKDYAFDDRSGVSTVSITDPQPGYGIWIDLYDSLSAGGEPYIDIAIKACWTPFGAKSDGEARILQSYRMHVNAREY